MSAPRIVVMVLHCRTCKAFSGDTPLSRRKFKKVHGYGCRFKAKYYAGLEADQKAAATPKPGTLKFILEKKRKWFYGIE